MATYILKKFYKTTGKTNKQVRIKGDFSAKKPDISIFLKYSIIDKFRAYNCINRAILMDNKPGGIKRNMEEYV